MKHAVLSTSSSCPAEGPSRQRYFLHGHLVARRQEIRTALDIYFDHCGDRLATLAVSLAESPRHSPGRSCRFSHDSSIAGPSYATRALPLVSGFGDAIIGNIGNSIVETRVAGRKSRTAHDFSPLRFETRKTELPNPMLPKGELGA